MKKITNKPAKKAPEATEPVKAPATKAKPTKAPSKPTKAAPEVGPAKPKKRSPREGTLKQAAVSEAVNQQEAEAVAEQLTADQQVAEARKALAPDAILFCEAYLTDFNATRSAMSAFAMANPHTAATAGWEKLKTPEITRYIAARIRQIIDAKEDLRTAMVSGLINAAFGDVNELVDYRRVPCRYCHGINNLYQFTPAELAEAKAKHVQRCKDKEIDPIPPFDELGGVGYTTKKPINPDCPECHGDGVGRVHINDTRHLSPAGRSLYAGAKTGKEGTEVKILSQEKAREMLAKYLKLYEDSATNVTLTLDQATLESRFTDKMRAARERQEQMLKERGEGD